jgi:pyruvate,water dikinase
MEEQKNYVEWFENLGSGDVAKVGGKNSSLGEMIRMLKEQGIRVPDGFATTSKAYWELIEVNDLSDKVRERIDELDQGKKSLAKVGKSIRRLFRKAEFPPSVSEEIRRSYRELSARYDH